MKIYIMINQRDFCIKLFKYEFYILWTLKFNKFNLTLFKISKVNNMSYMFSFCINLNNVDLSSFDSKNVIVMTNMFFKCENLINLEGDERQIYV